MLVASPSSRNDGTHETQPHIFSSPLIFNTRRKIALLHIHSHNLEFENGGWKYYLEQVYFIYKVILIKCISHYNVNNPQPPSITTCNNVMQFFLVQTLNPRLLGKSFYALYQHICVTLRKVHEPHVTTPFATTKVDFLLMLILDP